MMVVICGLILVQFSLITMDGDKVEYDYACGDCCDISHFYEAGYTCTKLSESNPGLIG